jgi:hypothetical protein
MLNKNASARPDIDRRRVGRPAHASAIEAVAGLGVPLQPVTRAGCLDDPVEHGRRPFADRGVALARKDQDWELSAHQPFLDGSMRVETVRGLSMMRTFYDFQVIGDYQGIDHRSDPSRVHVVENAEDSLEDGHQTPQPILKPRYMCLNQGEAQLNLRRMD